ncbi:MAG: hypothetical protein QOH49_3089 [Acidobacteriota bacterium]|nr:hypothetical protein [Acidobacteriota bacterium]
MKTVKAAALSAIGICTLLALLSPASSKGRAAENLQWGAPVDGLQMSILTAGSGNVDVPELQVALRNTGEWDVVLNLGIMLANGKVQLPERIRLSLTDADGRTRELRFFDKRYPAIAGRVDDYVVPLRVGSTYLLTFNLDQFWSPDAKDFQLKLSQGKSQLVAHFDGVKAQTGNLDMPGIRLMNFWEGKLQSNVLAIER